MINISMGDHFEKQPLREGSGYVTKYENLMCLIVLEMQYPKEIENSQTLFLYKDVHRDPM